MIYSHFYVPALAFYEVALKAIYMEFQPKNMDFRVSAQAHADIPIKIPEILKMREIQVFPQITIFGKPNGPW